MTEVPHAVRRKMHAVVTDEAGFQIAQARIRQARIAKFYQDNQPRAIEGIGGLKMAVDPFWVGYFNMMHRRNVFTDPDFSKWLAKEDEIFRVKSGGTRTQSGWSPKANHRDTETRTGDKIEPGWEPAGNRFTKKYADG